MTAKNKLIVDFLTSTIGSRIAVTTHREIAAWTIAAFYLTGLFVISKYLFDNNCSSNLYSLHLIIAIISIVLLCISVLVFIHSQYGSHVSNRVEYEIYKTIIFQLINNKSSDKIHNEIKNENLPEFIKELINKKMENVHKLSRIGPWVIYLWLYKVTCRLWNKIFCGKAENKPDNYNKLQLMESALYNFVLIPTAVVIWLTIIQHPNLLQEFSIFFKQ